MAKQYHDKWSLDDSVPWQVWYDPSQNQFFVRQKSKKGTSWFTPKWPTKMKVGARKARYPERYGCVYVGTL